MRDSLISMNVKDGALRALAEYHVASRNAGALKNNRNVYQLHYAPEIQKLVKEAPLHLECSPRFAMGSQRAEIGMSVEKAITSRTSGRSFCSKAIGLSQLASLLYLGNGVRRHSEHGTHVRIQRNVPNSGSLGSVEIYPFITNVTGIVPGIYHFDTIHHDLAQIQGGDFSTWLCERVFYQPEFSRASAALILVAAIGRLTTKYGLRGYRLALLDTGHVSQNIQLAATGLGLQSCATAGFIDDELDAAVGVDGIERASVLVVLIGP
jgi:SagB-type dehydrogenase family enzyme